MTGLASTAIYLASSLAAPQASGMVSHVAPVVAVPAGKMEEVATGPTEGPLADPFAQARDRGGKSLDEVVADEVRDSLAHPDTGFAFDSDHRGGDDMGGEVTAAHEARIVLIRQRMEALRSEGASAAPMLRRLRTRLDLALAARRLAVARRALERPPVECASTNTDACRPTLAAALSAGHARPSRSPEPARRGIANDVAVASSHLMLGVVAAHLADTGRYRSHRASGRPDRKTTRPVVTALRLAASRENGRLLGSGQENDQYATDHGVATALGHARRSLSAARDLLGADAGYDRHPRVRLAGLLRWEGSDTWSLAEYQHSTA